MDLFDVDSSDFTPALAEGDRLGFALRANAVIARSIGPGQRGRRHDVVMDALHAMPKEARASVRLDAVANAGRMWLARQGALHGFTHEPVTAVDGYDRMRVDRDGGAPAMFGVIDFNGALRVDDPARFLAAIATGFGRARAFGCGLMLIRRLTASQPTG
jgi:CRISPR system Cascade subunit CasE